MAENEPPASEHTAFQADFSDHYEHGISEERRRALEAHLASCPECRAENDRFQETMGALGKLGKASAPEHFDEKVTSTINRRSAGRFFGRRTFGDRFPFELFAVLGLALALAMVLLIRWSATGSIHDALKPGSKSSPNSNQEDVKDVLPVP